MSAWGEESASFINITSYRLLILQWMSLPSASMNKSNWTQLNYKEKKRILNYLEYLGKIEGWIKSEVKETIKLTTQ